MEAICTARRVINAEINGLKALYDDLDGFERAIEALDRSGKVIVTGIGKSGHMARKIAATMSSTGTPSIYMSAGDAGHGDIGVIGPMDALLILSKSGHTPELEGAIKYAKGLNVPIVAITADTYSPLARQSNIVLKLPKAMEANDLNAPTTSTTMMIALGDALAITLMERKQFSASEFHMRHPAGQLGMTLGTER
ncbi:MAG: SIS domain-containing protein [Gammaproteobacteria bacterium]